MKRIFFLTFISLFTACQLHSQDLMINLVYKLELNKDNKFYKRNDHYFLAAKKIEDGIEFKLDVIEEQASFYEVETLRSTELKYNMLKAFAGYVNPTFFNLKDKKVFFRPSFTPVVKEGKYLIEEPIFIDWKLSKDKKVVNGYVCYKATYINNDKKIIAWYTPQVSVPVGPLYYGGLPGVILQLQNEYATYTANEINFNCKDIEPINYNMDSEEKLTYKEYNNFLKKRMKDVTKELESKKSK